MQKPEVNETVNEKHSYHYWHAHVPKSSIPINTAPQKIEVPILQSQEAAKTGPSNWNTSGTWEERKISLKQLDQNLALSLGGTRTSSQQAHIISVSSSGQAQLIFARGKKSLTYDLKITIEFQGLNNFDDTSATLKFQQFNDTGDRQYSLDCQNGNNKDVIKKAVKGDLSRIIKIIQTELQRFKQM